MIEENKPAEQADKTVLNPAVTSTGETGQPAVQTAEQKQAQSAETPVTEQKAETLDLEQILKQGLEDEGEPPVEPHLKDRWKDKTKEDVIDSFDHYRAYSDSKMAKMENKLAEIERQFGTKPEPVTTKREPAGQAQKILTAQQLADMINTNPEADIGAVIKDIVEQRAKEMVDEGLKPIITRQQLEEQEQIDDYLDSFQEEGLGLNKPTFLKLVEELKNATTVDKQMRLIKELYMGKTVNQQLRKINQNRKNLSESKQTEAKNAFVGGIGAAGEKVLQQTTGSGEKVSPAKQGARPHYRDIHFGS